MNYRDWPQQLIYKVIDPVVHGATKASITSNFIITTGLAMNIVVVHVFVYTGTYKPGELAYMSWGGGVVLSAGLFDMMGGRVAHVGNMFSTSGTLYDSVLNRYSEMATLPGIFYYLILQGCLWGSVITFVALVGSLVVSYVRAHTEGLGLRYKVGFMRHPERVVLTSLRASSYGIPSDCEAFDLMLVLTVPMVVIAILTNPMASTCIAHCYKLLKKQ